MNSTGTVVAVSQNPGHTFSKSRVGVITLLAGLGVEGDAHCGQTVQHRSRIAADPTQPNLRQVHLIPYELFDELREVGFEVSPGQIGENITTQGLALMALPVGTLLHLGKSAVVEVTGLRNPCSQLDCFQVGLMSAVLARTTDGRIIRKAGIMGVVVNSGEVRPGDQIEVVLPALPHRELDRV